MKNGKKEGLNLLYKLGALLLLKYMAKYPSIDFNRVINTTRIVIRMFEAKLKELEKDENCLDVESLKQHKLLKEKHYVYAAFLGALSSYPILYKVADEKVITSAIFAKTAMGTSCKVLDNVNDTLHSFDDAINSMHNYYLALTTGHFNVKSDDNWVSKAENSSHVMASWAYDTITSICGKPKMFNVYVRDVEECIKGQLESFYQKRDKYAYNNLTLADYSQRISGKGIGKIWVDMDFCFFEKSLGKIGYDEIKAINLIGKSLDLIFRSTLFYDDVVDLKEDLESDIVNSTLMLGLELGKVSIEDIISKEPTLIDKVGKNGLISDTISVGDIFYLAGASYLTKAKTYSKFMDSDALLFCAKVLRLFNLRKLVMEKKNFKSLATFLQSLLPLKILMLIIPPYLNRYYKVAFDIAENSKWIIDESTFS